MDIGSFIVYVKTKYIYSDITKDVKTKFDTSNYESLPKGEKKIGLMKNELRGE